MSGACPSVFLFPSIYMSMNTRLIVSRYSSNTRLIIKQEPIDIQSIYRSAHRLIVDQASFECRSLCFQFYLDQKLVNCRWYIGQGSVEYRLCGCDIGQVPAKALSPQQGKNNLLFCGFVRISLARWPNFDRLSKDI